MNEAWMPPEMATQDEWWWYCWGCLRPEFDGVTVEWKPFGVKPILVHPLLRKQDKPLFCFRLQPLSHAQVQQCFLEDTVDGSCLWKAWAWSERWLGGGGRGGKKWGRGGATETELGTEMRGRECTDVRRSIHPKLSLTCCVTVMDDVSEQARECKWSCQRVRDKSGEAEYQMATFNVAASSRNQSSTFREALIMDGP